MAYNIEAPRRPLQSFDTVALAEWRLLNSLATHPELISDPRLNEDLFRDEEAKSLFKSICYLAENNNVITPASLLQHVATIDCTIRQEHANRVFAIDVEGDTSLDTALLVLKDAKLKDNILNQIKEIELKISEPGFLEKEGIASRLYDVENLVQESSKKDSVLMDFDEWAEIYEQDLEERKAGRKYTYGDPLLDETFNKGAYPGAITTIAASTSMGKSTYVLTLMNNLLDRNVPCMYLSLEMGAIDTFDRLIAMRCGIDNDTLYNADIDNINEIQEKVRQERQALEDRKNFYFSEATDVDIRKLRVLIREFKQRTHATYAIVAVDLITQMKNFMSAKNGSSTATAMEIGMNELNALAKEENVHIIGVAQFRRDSDNAKIHSVEEIDYLRPGLGDIKNSGALAERSRVVLSIFRPKYYADRYLQGNPEAEEMPDIMEVQVLKNSNGGSAGKIMKYTFDSIHFRLFPIVEEEKESNLDKIKRSMNELDIDY